MNILYEQPIKTITIRNAVPIPKVVWFRAISAPNGSEQPAIAAIGFDRPRLHRLDPMGRFCGIGADPERWQPTATQPKSHPAPESSDRRTTPAASGETEKPGPPRMSESSSANAGRVVVKEKVETLEGWPTDTVEVDWESGGGELEKPHTLLVFFPGNPGCIGWYTPNLVELVGRLGPGFAGRGVSYAGHSPSHPASNLVEKTKGGADPSIPWTVDGQIQHKSAYLDSILKAFRASSSPHTPHPRLFFLSHSIGAHMVERLCVLRPDDVLRHTAGILHLMPFHRMSPPPPMDRILEWGGANPGLLVGVATGLMRGLSALPDASWVPRVVEDPNGQAIAAGLLRQPAYAANFFHLGTEELRDVPDTIDVAALRILLDRCPLAVLYAGKDHWAPEQQMEDLKALKILPLPRHGITIAHDPDLRHDYVSYDRMVPVVVDWMHETIRSFLDGGARPPMSRL